MRRTASVLAAVRVLRVLFRLARPVRAVHGPLPSPFGFFQRTNRRTDRHSHADALCSPQYLGLAGRPYRAPADNCAFWCPLYAAGIFADSGGKSYAWLAMVMAIYAFFWHAILPQFEVISLAHLQGQTSRYSQIRLWGSIGFILAVVVLGRVFEWFSLDLFPYIVLAIMSGIALSSWWVPNAHPAPSTREAEAGGFLRQLGRPGVWAFYVSVALMVLSHGPYYTFLTLHLEALGYSRGLIGMLWALGVVAEVLMFMAMSRILQRFSVRQVLFASFLLAALRWLLLGMFADHLTALLIAQVMHAATFGSFHAAAIHFVQSSFGPRQQGQGQALYAALSGVGGALGALYSGYSWNALGPAWTFAIASLAAFAAAVMIVTPKKEEGV
ncbi:putative 3-phenylpropionic acid transporter [Pseudomonas syringae pv. helianthi]|nr:putative 3-phenylpropionic acid transporter [Pseudomonas syringae pv. helianthi]